MFSRRTDPEGHAQTGALPAGRYDVVGFVPVAKPTASSSTEVDLSVELDVELQSLHFERHRCGEGCVASCFTGGDRPAHRLLDFALGIDAHHFQELSNTEVQSLFVQGVLRVQGKTASLTQETWEGSSRNSPVCLLYTSDAADEEDSVDLGGRRI